MTSQSLEELKRDFAKSMVILQEQVASLQKAAPPDSPLSNKVYQAPAASDLFTGRTALLNQVEEAFNLATYPFIEEYDETSKPAKIVRQGALLSADDKQSDPNLSRSTPTLGHKRSHSHIRKQKRFILVGLGGSGKTEFCRKFAEQNQPK